MKRERERSTPGPPPLTRQKFSKVKSLLNWACKITRGLTFEKFHRAVVSAEGWLPRASWWRVMLMSLESSSGSWRVEILTMSGRYSLSIYNDKRAAFWEFWKSWRCAMSLESTSGSRHVQILKMSSRYSIERIQWQECWVLRILRIFTIYDENRPAEAGV